MDMQQLRPCATRLRLQQAPVTAFDAHPPLPGGALQERDPYGLPNVELSDHFRIGWGNSGGVSSADIANLVDALESAWILYMDDMEHPQPWGSDTWYFNVYIGDSGDGAPESYGAAGYYGGDPDGYPMLVVNAAVLDDENYTQITAAHELYHVVQGSLGTYDYVGASAWFWESTATWASAKLYPDNLAYASFLFAYMMLPHYPVNFFDYPDTGAFQEYYQYGSFIWPIYLSEHAADWTVIRDAWTDPGDGDDPLESLRHSLADRGQDLDEVWLDHLARNQTWDYHLGDVLQEWILSAANHYPQGANMVAAEHGPVGTETWVDGPSELRPRRYGSNAIRMEGGVEGTLNVYIDGEIEGSESSDASFGARLVLMDAVGGYEVIDVPFDGTWGEVATDAAGEAVEIWLVVGAWTEHLRSSRWEDEEFSYRYALLVDQTYEQPVDTGGDDTAIMDTGLDSGPNSSEVPQELMTWEVAENPGLVACGCAYTRRKITGAGMVLLIFMGLIRRRD